MVVSVDADEHVALLGRAYRLFNDRQIEALLAMMTDDVEWPDVANAEVLLGKEAVRRYWKRQFAVVDPQVMPVEFIRTKDGLVCVVEQRVLDLRGKPVATPNIVFHRYTFARNLVRRMVVFSDRDAAISGT